ncbi:hypothetical protein CANARDRAFT_159934 [[Candida] arabinofermentans NRRL YB-2248]|uniref:Uncharacterized protein n=1 Tax=[Candida] arabinofermentans NRRL YB-2248 TaxID=983967 RepID=A0A1E4T097_9ASCO|nr:hypothetical protein CANARDRAFT_159934 [[Candida] arabinofermentans NRRL YB-2248]
MSRSNSMTSLSGAAAAAALKRHSSNSSLQLNQRQSTSALRAGGRTMSLSSRSFRAPEQSNSFRRSNSFQPGQSNPYLSQRQAPISRTGSMTSNTYRPSNSRSNSLNSNSSRFTGTTTTTTTTTTKRMSNAPNDSVTTIVKTTKEKDAEGRTQSITKTTVEKKGAFEIVKTTVIKPAQQSVSYAGSIASDAEPFDDDFYHAYDEDQEDLDINRSLQSPVTETIVVDEPILEQIAEEEDPNQSYSQDVYDQYSQSQDAISPAVPLSTQEQATAAISHSYRKLTEAALVQPTRNGLNTNTTTSPVRSILKNGSSAAAVSPQSGLGQSTTMNDKKVIKTEMVYGTDDDDEENSLYSDAVQEVEKPVTAASVPRQHIDSEKVTEDIQSNASSNIQTSPKVPQRNAFRPTPAPIPEQQASPRQRQSHQFLQPPFVTQGRSNSLNSTSSSTLRKQVKINTPLDIRESPKQSPILKKQQQTPEEMYEAAYQIAMQKVYGDKNVQNVANDYEEEADQTYDDSGFDINTQKNTLLNSGASFNSATVQPRISKQSPALNNGRTMSMTSSVNNQSIQAPNTDTNGYTYQSNAQGLGFRTHSLREMPDSKTLKKLRQKELKDKEKKEKELLKENKKEMKRLSKQRESASNIVASEQAMETQPEPARPRPASSMPQRQSQVPQSPVPPTPYSPPVQKEEAHIVQQNNIQSQAPISAPVRASSGSLISSPFKKGTPKPLLPASSGLERDQEPDTSFSTLQTDQSQPQTSKKKKKFFGFGKSSKSKESVETPARLARHSTSSSIKPKRDSITVALPTDTSQSGFKQPPSLSSNPASSKFVNEVNLRDGEMRRAHRESVSDTNGKTDSDHPNVGRKFMKLFNL